MIPETVNQQEGKGVYPGKPAWHTQANPGRYFTKSPQCWYSRRTAHLILKPYIVGIQKNPLKDDSFVHLQHRGIQKDTIGK